MWSRPFIGRTVTVGPSCSRASPGRCTPTRPTPRRFGGGRGGAPPGGRVVGSRNSDGTANLTGYELPADQVAAACDRLDRLARAAKQAGHPDPIDHIRAGLFLAMTDGSYEGLTDPQILTHLLAQAKPTKPSTPTPNHPADNQPPDRPAGNPSADVSADGRPRDDP